MSKKKFIVSLSDEARQYLTTYVTTGQHSARSITRARVLLKADEGLSDSVIAAQVDVCKATVFNLRRRYCADGLQATLPDKPRPGAPRRFTGRDEAQWTTLACSDPPEGFQRWTVRLLADRLVRMEAVDAMSHTTVQTWLQKTSSNPGRRSNGAFARSAANF